MNGNYELRMTNYESKTKYPVRLRLPPLFVKGEF